MSIRVIATAFLLALFHTAVASAQPATRPARPNIVVFLADDLSLKDAAPYGNTEIPAPNMAALAQQGLTFDAAYATSPTCAPSRAALLTGCYNLRNGAVWNQQRPRADIKKWPAYFQSLGYEVVAIGKVAHYAQVQKYGFDYCGFFNYHQDVCIDEAVKWLDARPASDKPLCLMVGTNFPHVPWPERTSFAPDALSLPAKNVDTPRTREARTHYAAAVARADSDLGKIREVVRRRLPGDTLFVFSADQGAQWPFAKWNLYEAGLHVPLIVVWPGHVEANRRTDAMVSWIDVLPTLLQAAGADLKSAAPDLDGQSFLDVVLGRANAARDRIFGSHSGDGDVNVYPCRSVRIGPLKYIRNLDPDAEFHTHVDLRQADTGYFGSWVEAAKTDSTAAAALQRYYHRPAEELYDLSADPDEVTNLAADPARADDLKRMHAALDEWMDAHHDKGLASDRAIRPGGGANNGD
jgi:N-sulfoglucosamine sulfohydrolase